MSRGYGKYRRGNLHNPFQFDKLCKENSNKPSAVRSTGTVGKWGITSFTSIRAKNGLSQGSDNKSNGNLAEQQAAAAAAAAAVPKPKKFFKSRNSSQSSSSPTSKEYTTHIDFEPCNKRFKPDKVTKSPKKLTNHNRNTQKLAAAAAAANANTAANASTDDREKPPIVLRIYKGKSQLVNDSDESENTPTPTPLSTQTPLSAQTTASTSSTSPRVPNKSPSHSRVTRSTRRSIQQDPNSPATGDTAADSIFTSPRGNDALSPQYIPADKYEQERKAMYDNLLGTKSEIKADIDEAPKVESELDEVKREEELVFDVKDEKEEETEIKERNDSPLELDVIEEIEESKEHIPHIEETININQQQQKVEEDWSSSSDSESVTVKDEEAESMKSATIEEHKEEILEKILDPAPPTVKLVISKKKGSIFKSRSLVSDGTIKKRRALYKHKWSDDNKDAPKPEIATTSSTSNTKNDEFGFQDKPLEVVKREDEDGSAVTSVKCAKTDKGYYTVVRNVKKAHQMQEIGEFQEFNDDVEYILDALQEQNPIATRCLSAITLAGKCMAPAFRMHVRAHGTVAKFFKALHDATKDQSLGLCTATVMFVLSQDRLNMDLDRDCLELMLNLLESDVNYKQALDVCGLSQAQLEKNKMKVRELCAEIQSQGHAMHLNLDNITVGQLAMETLLSLTSKRAGEWFKEELRQLGGLEHIMKTICECCRQVSDYVVSWTDTLLDKLRKIDRCLRVLENVTHNNEENQMYLLKYDEGVLLDTLVKLYRLCDAEIPLYPVTDIGDKESAGAVIREALLVTLKVLINLTHHFNKRSCGNTLIGSRPGIVDASLHLLLQVPQYIPDQKKFELGVLVLMLLINLIQDNDTNKKLLMDAKAPAECESIFSCDKSAVEALTVQFFQWEECAKLAEKRTDAILDGEKDTESASDKEKKSNEEFIEETVAKLLQKAGSHMEFTFLASYLVLLIGYLIMDSPENQTVIRKFLKNGNFAIMVELLKKFYNFMNLTASTEASSMCVKETEKVIKYLEECDKIIENEAQ